MTEHNAITFIRQFAQRAQPDFPASATWVDGITLCLAVVARGCMGKNPMKDTNENGLMILVLGNKICSKRTQKLAEMI